MSTTWLVVLLVGAFTIVFKAAGPVLLARQQRPAGSAVPYSGVVEPSLDESA